ncbi:MAG TPA: ABC transporter permease [Deltaproteobacteria bacterium]|nr:ABC transporter permease [Deltaproteobacteria bacterium]HPR55714.1 ABC transporter permease [Deltaproteobacteria bacterium]HXK47339.1 ABC transporter permease [Deltaproteobacteria bacterium]
MAVPLSYNLRNLWARRLTTFLTASGMALVVFVFAAILMLAEGLQKTLVQTGSPDNVVVLRKGSTGEVDSGIDRSQAAVVETIPSIAADGRGGTFMAREVVILITLPKKPGGVSNVTIRGMGEDSLALRPQVRIVQGRMPRFGVPEMAVGTSLAKRFRGLRVGDTLCCGLRNWRIVGIIDAGNTAFSSEIWADADQIMQSFRRPVYSSLIFRLSDPERFESVRSFIEGDPRLTLMAKRETVFYLDQSEMMAKFLRILGVSLTVIFSLGAMIGAMITMYAAVANRTAEIGTLRALGFRRRAILASFLMESLLLGFIGGCFGLFFASFMQILTISTVNFQTFSELAFRFALSPGIILQSLAFSLVMGLAGGFLPAVRASRMNIVEALRAN